MRRGCTLALVGFAAVVVVASGAMGAVIDGGPDDDGYPIAGGDGPAGAGESFATAGAGSLSAAADGQASRLVDVRIGEPINTLELAPVDRTVNYRVEVSGAIQRGGDVRGRDTNPDDEVGEDYAAGVLRPDFQGDSFRYSGRITGFSADGPVRVWVNGEALASGEVVPTVGPDQHVLEVVEQDADASYRVEVDGSIERGPNVNARDSNPDDEVGDGYVEGVIDAGYQGDSYLFTGSITSIDVDGGPVTVLVDGEPVDRPTNATPDLGIEWDAFDVPGENREEVRVFTVHNRLDGPINLLLVEVTAYAENGTQLADHTFCLNDVPEGYSSGDVRWTPDVPADEIGRYEVSVEGYTWEPIR